MKNATEGTNLNQNETRILPKKEAECRGTPRLSVGAPRLSGGGPEAECRGARGREQGGPKAECRGTWGRAALLFQPRPWHWSSWNVASVSDPSGAGRLL